jgi:hypothetical protein
VLAGIRFNRFELVSSWRGEGAWGYAPFCTESGLQYGQEHWHSVTAGVRECLGRWGRRGCTNGFRAFLISSHAASLRIRPPHRRPGASHPCFRNHLVPLAAELGRHLHRIKQDLAAAVDRAGLDVIAWLDLNRLGWRDALPVDMVDGDARTLAAIGGCRPGRPPPRGGAPPRERQGWPRARGSWLRCDNGGSRGDADAEPRSNRR